MYMSANDSFTTKNSPKSHLNQRRGGRGSEPAWRSVSGNIEKALSCGERETEQTVEMKGWLVHRRAV